MGSKEELASLSSMTEGDNMPSVYWPRSSTISIDVYSFPS